MAQHDYDVANGTGAAVRADINALAQAIASLNSGTSAPSVTIANMLWYDSTNALLKIRNPGNTAWVLIGAFASSTLTLDASVLPYVGAPITKTADWTVGAGESRYISNKGSTATVTLPVAASYPGRKIEIKTIQAFTVVSATGNVVPQAGGAAGTAILAATAGKWCVLESDGANWQIMQSN